VNPTVAENMKFYDVWGTDQTYPHYAVGWAYAFDTPYQWTKEVASHFGGTRNGMAMAWPARIKDAGGTSSTSCRQSSKRRVFRSQ
jgi:arylsulfatase A-like enzyme